MKVGYPHRITAVTAAVAAITVISACSSSSSTTTSSSGTASAASTASSLQQVQVMEFPGQSYRLPVGIAEQEGFFTKNGIKVSIVAQPNNLEGAQAMIATHSQVGILATSTLTQGAEAGEPVAFFCGGISVLQTELIAAKGSSLPSTSDGASSQDVLKALNGKKIGVQTPVGSGLQLLFAAALKAAGVTNVTYVNLGGGNNLVLSALKSGSVDVAQVNPPGTQELEAAGEVKPLLYMPDGSATYQLYGSGWTGQTSWLKSDPSAARGFCNALTEALAFIKNPANLSTSASALATDTGLTQSVAKLVVQQGYADFSTSLSQSVLTKTFEFYSQIGIAKSNTASQYTTLVQPAS